MKFEISCCVAGERKRHLRGMEVAIAAARGARVDRGSRRPGAARPDRRRPAPGRHAARPARPRRAPRRLPDAGPLQPRPARARGVRRRRGDRPRVREPPDTRGLRGDLRRPARASRASPRGSARQRSAHRRRAAWQRCSPASARPPRSRTSTPTSRSAGSSTARATARAADAGWSRRSSASTGAPSGTTDSCCRHPIASASRCTATRSFQTACLANDGAAAEAIVQESLRWAVGTVAAGLPSETASA